MILNDLLFFFFLFCFTIKKIIVLNANCERKSYKKVFSFRSISPLIIIYSNVSVKFVVDVVVFKSSAWRNEGERERHW